MINKKDLYIDRVYKLCAPIMLLFVAYSYIFSVKPIFDKQQELNEKSSAIEILSAEVDTLEKDRALALSKLHDTKLDLKSKSYELKNSNESLEKSSRELSGVTLDLKETKSALSRMKITIRSQESDINENKTQLETLHSKVNEKNKELKELNKSLARSEDAAVSFYVYRVVNEVSNEAINRRVYSFSGSSSNEFSLYDLLIEKSKIDNNKEVDKFSQKYYENKAKIIIRQFTNEKIARNEKSYKPAFDLYTYTFKKQAGLPTE